jgi:hypothetical protein
MKIDQVRKHAMSLEAVTEAPHHNYSSFRVGGKIFVTVPPDGAHIHAFVPEDEREKVLALYPNFVEKLVWGDKAVGVRVRLVDAAPSVVRQLVNLAYTARIAKNAGPKVGNSSQSKRETRHTRRPRRTHV